MKIHASVLALTAATIALAGCDNDKVSYKDITGDLTPELQGIAQTPREYHNDFAVAANQNLRMFWDDLGRVFYTDHPSRLSPYPITYTGGAPR